MPFEKGNQLAKGIGRPALEYEQEQLQTMRKLLDKYLLVAGRILGDTEKEKDARKIQLLSSDMKAILNKLHASRQTQEHSGEINLPTPIYNGQSVQKHNGNEKDIPIK